MSEKFNIERPTAAPLPEWKRWHREGVAGGPMQIITPDNREYLVPADEKFILDPKEPVGEQMPQPFIEKADGTRIPFDEWASMQEEK